MDEKENKQAQESLDKMLYFGMLNSGLNSMNTMSPLIPLTFNTEESKENKEKKLRE